MNTAMKKVRCIITGHKYIRRSQPNHVVLLTCRRCGRVDDSERSPLVWAM